MLDIRPCAAPIFLYDEHATRLTMFGVPKSWRDVMPASRKAYQEKSFSTQHAHAIIYVNKIGCTKIFWHVGHFYRVFILFALIAGKRQMKYLPCLRASRRRIERATKMPPNVARSKRRTIAKRALERRHEDTARPKQRGTLQRCLYRRR